MTPTATPEQFERSFRAAEASRGAGQGAVRRRLLPTSSLDVFAEVRFPGGNWALVVQSREHLNDRDLVLANGLTCRVRNGSIEVMTGPQTDRLLFCTLLADLVFNLGTSPSTPATALVRRLTAWRRMLGRGLLTGLTPEARLGLYGELLVLRELMLPAAGGDAVRAWVGPSGSPQDFVLPPTSVEVKTVSRRDPDRCRINHERQLDTTDSANLFLVHQVVANSSEGSSLEELIDELRNDQQVHGERGGFENALLEAGWLDTHRDQYANDRYALVRRQCFIVDEGFPRMVPGDLPPGVSGVSYLVDLSTCGSHRVEEGLVRGSVAKANRTVEE